MIITIEQDAWLFCGWGMLKLCRWISVLMAGTCTEGMGIDVYVYVCMQGYAMCPKYVHVMCEISSDDVLTK